MDEEKKLDDIIEEVDREIQALTGGTPQQFDVNRMFTESQAIQKSMYGGGEENELEKKYLDGIRTREEEIQKRKEKLLEDADEVEELNDLELDGIFIKK
jgi:hypothetical protein